MAQVPTIEGAQGGKVEGGYTEHTVGSHRQQHDLGNAPANVGGPADTPTSAIADFAHPATREAQQIVWIPQDPLGVGETEAAACQAYGVRVSMEGAVMNGKGRVDVDRPPPGFDVAAMSF
jgi:hypothetical protein